MFTMHFSQLHRRLAPWLVLLLLLAQGLRICIPAHAEDAHHDGVHLESLFTVVADQHESDHDTDTDLSVSGLFKLLSFNLAWAGLFVFVLVLSASRPAAGGYAFDERCFRPLRGAGFPPPLRAPPR